MSDIPPSRGSRAAPPTVNVGDAAPLGDRADNRVLVPAIEGAPPRPPSDLIRSLGGETMGTTWSARVIAPPGEVQVGIVTAFIGAPFFIALVRRRKLAAL